MASCCPHSVRGHLIHSCTQGLMDIAVSYYLFINILGKFLEHFGCKIKCNIS